jgi:hypothetical protein
MKGVGRYKYNISRSYSIYLFAQPELRLTLNNDNNFIVIWLSMKFAPVA